MVLNVACVCVGDAFPPQYVEILYSMVRRNLAAGTRGRFTVLTDNPAAFSEMAGVEVKDISDAPKSWWAKLWLFKPGMFPKGERVLYFDLDTVITGSLDEIVAYQGPFAMLRDIYRFYGLQSSVMAWEAGTFEFLSTKWLAQGGPRLKGGDQEWIENKDIGSDHWQDLFPGRFRSYKVDCQEFVPKGTSVVFFHGRPRPHEVKTGWVPDVWKVSNETLFFSLNVKEREIRRNIAHALTKPHWIEMRDGLSVPALIVGGGPSLKDQLWRIKGYQLSGGVIFATNNSWAYLKKNGITADAQAMHDAREGNLPFVAPQGICYYASQCHPKVLDAAGDRLICWHPHSETCIEIAAGDPKGEVMVSGGSTVGLNAIALAYILGHRQFLIFGMDSSYAEGEHHAYEQTLNDGELLLDVEANGQKLKAAPWMIQQAEQFMTLLERLRGLQCSVSVFGYGLLPIMAASLAHLHTAADERAQAILRAIEDIPNPVGAEIGVFAGDLSSRLLLREDLTLYLVDSWTDRHKPQYRQSGDFHATLSARDQERYFEVTRRAVHFAGQRARIVRKDSQLAAQDFEDRSLDFVFIDADHSYEGCKADIEAWAPKIKKGGFLCGHDYENPGHPGVARAVKELLGPVHLAENYTWFKRNLYGSA